MEKLEIQYSVQEIAELLGVGPSSINRWTDSGKLKCFKTDNGDKIFSVEHLKEFAATYNISMKFLYEPKKRENDSAGNYYRPISIAQ